MKAHTPSTYAEQAPAPLLKSIHVAPLVATNVGGGSALVIVEIDPYLGSRFDASEIDDLAAILDVNLYGINPATGVKAASGALGSHTAFKSIDGSNGRHFVSEVTIPAGITAGVTEQYVEAKIAGTWELDDGTEIVGSAVQPVSAVTTLTVT